MPQNWGSYFFSGLASKTSFPFTLTSMKQLQNGRPSLDTVSACSSKWAGQTEETHRRAEAVFEGERRSSEARLHSGLRQGPRYKEDPPRGGDDETKGGWERREERAREGGWQGGKRGGFKWARGKKKKKKKRVKQKGMEGGRRLRPLPSLAYRLFH